MINHFRSLLLNLSDVGDTSEHIAPGFAARALSGKPLALYSILFPQNTNRQTIINLGNSYLELIEAANLSEVITLIDSRITYDLKKDFNQFKSGKLKFPILWNKLNGNADTILSVLSLPSEVDTTKYDNIYRLHPNKVYKVAGLLASYVLRLT